MKQGDNIKGLTFDKDGESGEKEKIEWLRLWCEDTDEKNLPRVALIGDSITEQTFVTVKEKLSGIAKVDYLATSYSILSKTYFNMVKSFCEDSEYSLIYINYGLHAYNVSDDDYENAYREIVKTLMKKSKVIIGLTTSVKDYAYFNIDSEIWKTKIKNRNERAIKIAKEFNLAVDDLYATSKNLGKEFRLDGDGVHFNDAGIKILGEQKAKIIKNILEN